MTALFNIHTVCESVLPKLSEQEESSLLPLRTQVVSSSSPTDGGVTCLASGSYEESVLAGVNYYLRS